MIKNQIFSRTSYLVPRTSYLVALCWLLLVPLLSFGQSITVDAGNPTYTGQSVTFTLEPPCGTVTQMSWNTNGGSINWQSGSSVSVSWSSVGYKTVSVSFTYVCDNVSYYSSASTDIVISEPPPPPPCLPATNISFTIGTHHLGIPHTFAHINNLSPCDTYSGVIYFKNGEMMPFSVSGSSTFEYDGMAYGQEIASICISSHLIGTVCS